MISTTEELVQAREKVDNLRQRILDGDPSEVDELIQGVREYDIAVVKARQQFRDEEFYPYYPESFTVENETYDDIVGILKGGDGVR
jgi:hypothetical protein